MNIAVDCIKFEKFIAAGVFLVAEVVNSTGVVYSDEYAPNTIMSGKRFFHHKLRGHPIRAIETHSPEAPSPVKWSRKLSQEPRGWATRADTASLERPW